MIPTNPDAAYQTDRHDFPTLEALRAMVRIAARDAALLRYDAEDTYDAIADVIYDLLPTPPERGVTYEDLENDLATTADELALAEDEIAEAEDTIRELRAEVLDLQDQIDKLIEREIP